MSPATRSRRRALWNPWRRPAAHAPWLDDSFTDAAAQVISFFGDEGVDLRGTRVADIGCGDGVMDLGLFLQAGPSALVGFDIKQVNPADLLARAAAEGAVPAGGTAALPDGLRFDVCEPDRLPAEDASFDHVFSWSAFEHVLRPLPVLGEIHRVLRPGGMLMIQLWPFYHSKHGSHLWDWFPEGFGQLLHDPFEVERRVRDESDRGPAWTDALLEAFRELNRMTLDDLHRALLQTHFDVVKVELVSEPFHIPVAISHLPLSLLAIAGVKLLAVPR